MEKRVLFWCTDTQKDFMLKTGKLYIPGAEEIIPKLKEITELAHKLNCEIINTGDLHTDNSKELSENPDFKTTFPKHCMIDSEGMEFIDETNPTIRKNYCTINWFNTDCPVPTREIDKSNDIIIYKDAFDVFKGNKFTDDILNILKPKIVVVYGVATNVCVKFAVEGLLKRNIKVMVIKDAMKGLGDCKQLIKSWDTNDIKAITVDQLTKLLYYIEKEIKCK